MRLTVQKLTRCSIIIVHGPDGCEKTWTASNGTYWPRDLLPSDIPNARILSWGYDVSTYGDPSSLLGHARQLLSDLCSERDLTQVRDK